MPADDPAKHPFAAQVRANCPTGMGQPDGFTTLVAVSGGPDSVALLRALTANGETGRARLVVAHFNHQWRGGESLNDEAFVAELAKALGLRCEVGRASATSVKSEELARAERYAFLVDAAHRCGARYVAVGHTADDQAETVLFRLLRGTGLSGLTGMPQFRSLSEATTLIRPMLALRRRDVLDYLADLQQPYQTDRSNADLRFARNRLRQEALPLLASVSQGDVTAQLVELGRQVEELLAPVRTEASRLLDVVAEMHGQEVQLHFDRCESLSDRTVLRELFVELWRRQHWPRGEMTSGRWEELADLALGETQRVLMLPGAIRVERVGRMVRLVGHSRGNTME